MLNESSKAIICEVCSSNCQSRSDLVNIARTCANDLEVPLALAIEERGAALNNRPLITITVPAELTSDCEPALKLANCIAGFCPYAKVCARVASQRANSSTNN